MNKLDFFLLKPKGGEKMQVVAPGFVNSAVMPNDHVQSGTGQDRRFANLLSGIVQPPNSSRNVEKVVTEDTGQLSNEELTKLIQFLDSSDLTDIEFGSTLLDNLLSDVEVNMTDLVKESLQLSDENIVSAITAFLKDLNIDTEKENSSLSEEELSIVIEELPQMEANEAIAVFINILPFINIDQVTLTADQSFADLAKSLKLLEVLSHYEKSTVDQQKIKEFLQKTIEKLEVLLKGNVLTDRSEFLNKVFNPVVREVNERSVVNQNLVYGDLFSIQQMSKPVQITLMQNQLGKSVSTDQLIEQFESILSKSQFLNTGGNQKLFIKLYPEHLGALRIELIQKESLLIAKMMTTTSTAKDLLESQIQSLKHAFSSQNIQVEKIEISHQMNGQERFINRDPQQQQEQRQQREQDEQKQQNNSQFGVSFEEALLNVEV